MSFPKALQLLANKLGLGDETKVISKAAELERLLLSKSLPGNVVTDTAKTVICLDLAATMLGVSLDVKSASRFSGLKPSIYQNSRKTIENILQVSEGGGVSVASLCALLQCARAQALAEEILTDYQRQSKVDVDLSLPHYACMAVYQACRVINVKVSRSKLQARSRLKAAQWARAAAEWAPLADARAARAQEDMAVDDDKEEINEETETQNESQKEAPEPQVESYVDWKRRMLDIAYKEIEQESDNLRRSPRKTPQKFSPYKTPEKSKGVRLLFKV